MSRIIDFVNSLTVLQKVILFVGFVLFDGAVVASVSEGKFMAFLVGAVMYAFIVLLITKIYKGLKK